MRRCRTVTGCEPVSNRKTRGFNARFGSQCHGCDGIVEPRQLQGSEYVVAVDEFAEAEIAGIGPLTGKEFREVCDAYKTKPGIVQALGRQSP